MPARNRPAPNPPEARPLFEIIKRRIEAEGPITVAEFMDLALRSSRIRLLPVERAVRCQAANFVTAPEVSQVFGELIGLWLATAWTEAGRPTPCRLTELGPGRGQLMADLLRATAKVPGFLEAADSRLVETSETPARHAADETRRSRDHLA